MGIKYFFGWFKETYKRAVSNSFHLSSDDRPTVLQALPGRRPILLLLDLNEVIHSSCQKVYDYGSDEPRALAGSGQCGSGRLYECTDVYESILQQIDTFVKAIDPVEVVICIDGVVPVSKQIQQRQRRFLSRKTNCGFDPNCISPGTTFLCNLDAYLKSRVQHKMENEWTRVSTFHLMDSSTVGEGEHKLFDFLRSRKSYLDQKKFDVVVVGNDADLIMLSIVSKVMFLHKTRMYILRKDFTFKKFTKYLLVDVNLFKKDLLKKCKECKPGFEKEHGDLAVCDFAVLCLMAGNDFVPQLPLFNIYDGSLDSVMNLYFTTRGYVTFSRHGKIRVSTKNFMIYVDHVFRVVYPKVISQYKTRERGYRDTLLDAAILKDDYPTEYARSYSECRNITENLVKSYLDEIRWVLDYYVYGAKTVDWSAFYPAQFAPSPIDLLEYVELQEARTTTDYYDDYYDYPAPKHEATSPFFQLLCVLPKHSSDLLPSSLKKVLCEDMDKFHPLDTVKIDYEGKLNKWEGIPILPVLDHKQVYALYEANVNLSKDELQRNKRGHAFTILVVPTDNHKI
jgi:5'-3' exonuclease